MPFTTQQLRTISRPFIQQTSTLRRSSIRMSSTNQFGQGASHATGQSAVPNKVQDVAPKGVEEALPDGVSLQQNSSLSRYSDTTTQVHPTSSDPTNQSTGKTHALNDGEDSIVPKKVQEIVPESVERGKDSNNSKKVDY